MSGGGEEKAAVDASLKQKVVGRYALHGPISAGGMASVHFGRLLGSIGFRRIVAIKRLHAPFARDPQFVAMFLDEARLAARIHHPNVVGTLDVVDVDDELFLVMEYVRGLSLSALGRVAGRVAPDHTVGIVVGALHGLHAAHEARNGAGVSLEIVHRDVSPPNILVGEDGVARVIDFGVAKARERIHSTRGNDIRGKVRYMAPEQLVREPVDRRADIYAASVVLWELLTSRSYVAVETNNATAMIRAVVERRAEAPSALAADVPRALDEIVLRGLARDPAKRFASAHEMAIALESAMSAASQGAIGSWVSKVGADTLEAREAIVRRIEAQPVAESEPVAETHPSEPPPPPAPAVVSDVGPGPVPSTSRESTRAVSRPGEPPERRFDLRPLVGAAAVGAIVVAWLVGTAHGRGRGVAVDVDPPEASRASTNQAVFPPPPVIEPPSADSASAPPASSARSAPASAPASPRVGASHARPAKASCSPPYTIDHGIRVPKPECL